MATAKDPKDPQNGLTFLSNLGAGAIWTALPLADAAEPDGVKADTAAADAAHRLWIWSPRQLLSFEGTRDNLDLLTAAGWEPIPERRMLAAGLRIYHLWTQLREIRGVQVSHVQVPGQVPGEEKDLWAHAEDLHAVERCPVALAFTISPYPADRSARALFAQQRAQGQPFHAWTSETLPPPSLGTHGLVWTESGNAGEQGPGWQRYDLAALPAPAHKLQEQLAAALRELATPHSWYMIGLSMHAAITSVAQPLGYHNKRAEMQAELLARTGYLRDVARAALADLEMAKERYEQMSLAARKYPPDIWLARWGEVQQMAQELAAAYWEYHQSQHAAVPPTRQVPAPPNVFRSDHSLIVSPLNALQIAQGLSSRTWQTRQDGTPYYRAATRKGAKTGENTSTEMELRLEDAPEPPLPAQEQVTQLWQLTRARSDLDGDLFLAQWAQYLNAPKEPEGYVWLTGDQFLVYRGIEPITKAEPDGDRRRAGQRTEDKQEISAALVRQMAVWVRVRAMLEGGHDANNARRKRLRARRQYTHESRLWLVPEVVRQHELSGATPDKASSHIVAWRYKPGTWATPFLEAPNRHFAQLCQTTLRYDPYRQQWEKRLARFFMFYLRISGGPNYGGTTIRRAVGDLLTELELPIDIENPQRTRQRFEQALAQLVADRVIDAWDYAKDNQPLPRRRWLLVWERWGIYVTAAPLARPELPEDSGQSDASGITPSADN
jgi:hypothetical protein